METLSMKPLSINKCWAGRRFKTPDYKAWREEAEARLREHPRAPDGQVEVHIKFYFKNSRSDIDNCIKPFLDALTDANRIEDDRHVVKLVVEKIMDKDERIEYEIKTILNT